MTDLTAALVIMLITHPAKAFAVAACTVSVAALTWIVVMLRAEPDDRLARVVAVVPAPPAPPAARRPDPPLVNPKFAAHIAAQSARFAAHASRGTHARWNADPRRNNTVQACAGRHRSPDASPATGARTPAVTAPRSGVPRW